jgi:uncharacterized membrane protein YphA (DoxX/SURF4 family)
MKWTYVMRWELMFLNLKRHSSALLIFNSPQYEKLSNTNMGLTQMILRILAAVFIIVAGTFHFLKPELYLQIVPPYLPTPRLLVIISGAAEIAGGFGLMIPSLRVAAAWGLARHRSRGAAHVYSGEQPPYLLSSPAYCLDGFTRMKIFAIFAVVILCGCVLLAPSGSPPRVTSTNKATNCIMRIWRQTQTAHGQHYWI